LNVKDAVETVNVLEETFRVTGTLSGLLDAPESVIWMLPL
jgi:hypothetical protein